MPLVVKTPSLAVRVARHESGHAALQKCQKPQDYDTWSPPLPQQCLLGRNITMQRRKPEAMCFNGYDFTADDKISACNCTEADIECEFGFEWSGHDCMPVPHVEASQCPVRAAQTNASRCWYNACVWARQTQSRDLLPTFALTHHDGTGGV